MRVGEGAGEGRGPGTEGDPLLSRASGPEFPRQLDRVGEGSTGPLSLDSDLPSKGWRLPQS